MTRIQSFHQTHKLLIEACERGDLPEIKELLQSSTDPLKNAIRDYRPLYFAVKNNHYDVVHYLADVWRADHFIYNISLEKKGKNIRSAILFVRAYLYCDNKK